jgi:hypothetical protein
MPRLFVDVEARFAQFQQSLDKITQSTHASVKQIEKAFGGVRTVLSGLGAGVSVGAFATALIRETKEAEQASARLSAALRATGGAAGFTKGELDELAESMQDALGFDDEAVRDAQATLLRFGNIQGRVFKDAIRLSADLAAALGTDLPEAAQQIGRALQSPTEGLRGFQQAFGKLAPEQEKFIHELVRQGRAVEAQREILKLYEERIGGTAKEMNTGLTKATRDAANAWGDFLEALGQTEGKLSFVREGLSGLSSLLKDVTSSISGAGGGNKLREQAGAMQEVNEQIENLQNLRAGSGFSRALAGLTTDEIDRRLKFLKERRGALLREYQQFSQAVANIAAEEAALAGAVLQKPLGGDAKDGGDAQLQFLQDLERARREAESESREIGQLLTKLDKEAEFRAEKAIELQEMAATDAREAWEAYTKARLDQEAKIKAAQQEGLKALFETIDLEQEQAIERGQELLDAEAEALKRNADLARDLGFTFESAFENAVLEGEKLQKVLQGIAKDIARIILRRTITQPIAEGISGYLATSGRAEGGPVRSGRPYIVGEEGPELFVPGQSGSIIPNGAAGVTIKNGDINISGSGVTMMEVRAALEAQHRRTVATVQELRQR